MQFANILLRSFASTFMRDISLWFPFLVISLDILIWVLVRVGYKDGEANGVEIISMSLSIQNWCVNRILSFPREEEAWGWLTLASP